MRALVQRVKSARVSVEGREIARIGEGALVFLGVAEADGHEQSGYLVNKIVNLRIFQDEQQKMNKSLLDMGGEALVVSQFTLYADTRKGRRPSFVKAAHPDIAEKLVDAFVAKMRDQGIATQSGRFGAHMLISLENDGPVTVWLERE